MTDTGNHSVEFHESRTSFASPAVLLIVVAIAALALRLYRLDHESLWYDELAQAAIYHLPPAYLVREAAGHGQPPLDYLIGAVLHHAGLDGSDWWIRLPAAIFGALSVWLAGLLVWRCAGFRAGILSSVLLALCPLHLVMSQEARPYTIFVCLALATLLAYGSARRRHRFGAWAFFAICATAMLFCRWVGPNVVMMLIAGTAAIFWLAGRCEPDADTRRRETQRLWASGTAITFAYAVYGPVFGIIVDHASRAVGTSLIPWHQRWTAQLADAFQAVLAGYSTSTLFYALPAPTWLMIAAGLLMLPGLVMIVRACRSGREDAAALLVLVAFPLVYAAIYCQWTYVQPKPQYLLLMCVPVVALIAITIDLIASRAFGRNGALRNACTIALVLLFALPLGRASWDSLRRTDKRAWRDVITYLHDHARRSDAFAVIGADVVPAVYHPVVSGKHRYGLGWATFVPIEIDTNPRDLDTPVWRSTANTVWIVGIKDRLYLGRDQLVPPAAAHNDWSVHDAHGLFVVGVPGGHRADDRLLAGLRTITEPLPEGRGAVAAHLFRGRVLMARGLINRAHRAFAAAVRQCRTPEEMRTLVEDYLPAEKTARLTAARP